MNKIGILTFHRAINYGASLQTFALMTVLKKEENTEVFQIDLNEPYITDGSKLINIRKENFIRSLIGTVIRFPASVRRNRKFKKFWKKYLNFSEKYDENKTIGLFDCYIVGSDQVWNFDIIGNDFNFLLDIEQNRSKIKKMSYAASIGKTELSDSEKKIFYKYLSDFDSISVRESSAQLLLNDIQIESEVVLDPTLLLTENEWIDALNIIPNKDEKFILVYTLEDNVLIKKAVDFYKKELGIIKVTYVSSSINLHKLSNTYSPKEFISLFKDASFVITNSFHGTAFAVNFNKQFVTVPHKTRGSRMIDFLNLVDLKNQVLTEQVDLREITTEIDYTKVNKILNLQRDKSMQFLQNTLR